MDVSLNADKIIMIARMVEGASVKFAKIHILRAHGVEDTQTQKIIVLLETKVKLQVRGKGSVIHNVFWK